MASTELDAGQVDGGWWKPTAGLSWQLQLTGVLDVSVDAAVFDVDLFDTSQSDVERLHLAGHRVVCQFNAGLAESTRSDVSQLPAAALGNATNGGHWVDTRALAARTWASGRFDLARTHGCDAVEPTGVDSYQSNTGFPLGQDTATTWVQTLATEAHARGLAVAMSNVVELAPRLVDQVDFATNEECLRFNECGTLTSFVQQNKPVFHFETGTAADLSRVCGSRPSGFSTILKQAARDAWLLRCP